MFAGVKAKKSGAQNRQIKKKKDDDCKKGSQTLASCIDKLKKKRDEGESVVNEHSESQIDEVEPLDDNGLSVELYSHTVSIGSNLGTVTFLLGPEFNIQVTNHCMLESPIGSPDTPGASDYFLLIAVSKIFPTQDMSTVDHLTHLSVLLTLILLYF
jgi:hypothetical protein